MAIQLSILVGNNDTLMGQGYTRLEIWETRDLGNSYEEITASTSTAATVTSLAANTTFLMGGKLLKYIIDGGSEVSVSFSTTVTHWTPQQVVDRINEVTSGFASLSGSSVVLTSSTTGRASSVLITYNDAEDLGFTVGKSVYGKAARITLVSGTKLYTFIDPSGLTTNKYKWRFSANGVNPISDFSLPVDGTTSPLLDSSQLSVCTATFVGSDGKAQKTKVIVGIVSNPSNVSGYVAYDALPLIFESDATGYLAFTLIRGSTVRVAIEGTHFVREFTVPSTSTFDLLTVMAAATDPFTVQTVPDQLIRRTP